MATRQEQIDNLNENVNAALDKVHRASGDVLMWHGVSNWIEEIRKLPDPRIDIGVQNNMKLRDDGNLLSGPSDEIAAAIREVIKTKAFFRFLRDTVSGMTMDSAKDLDDGMNWLQDLRDEIDRLPPPPAD